MSKRTRARAISVLRVAASQPGELTAEVADDLGVRWASAVGWLVRRVRSFVEYNTNHTYQQACAEAALLLEEGWTP